MNYIIYRFYFLKWVTKNIDLSHFSIFFRCNYFILVIETRLPLSLKISPDRRSCLVISAQSLSLMCSRSMYNMRCEPPYISWQLSLKVRIVLTLFKMFEYFCPKAHLCETDFRCFCHDAYLPNNSLFHLVTFSVLSCYVSTVSTAAFQKRALRLRFMSGSIFFSKCSLLNCWWLIY